MEAVRDKAMVMVSQLGMSKALGPLAYESTEETLKDKYSDRMRADLEKVSLSCNIIMVIMYNFVKYTFFILW